MAGAHVEFTGDASGAAEAAAAAQAAIDAVHGKTVNVDVNVRTHGGGVADSARALDQHARASERAAAGAREHERASSRAASSAREHAAASDRASVSAGRLGDSSERAGGNLERTGRSAARAGGQVGGFGRENDRADRSSRSLGQSVDQLGDAMADLGGSASGATRSLAGAMSSARGISSVMSLGASAVQGFAISAAYATAGSAILTAGVGALGAVGVGALGGVGVAAGVAGGAMANFAVEAHKDSARFGNSLGQLGKQSHLAAQAISEPMAEAVVGLGRSMVGADNVMTPRGAAIVASLRDGFGNAAGVMNRASGDITSSAEVAARGVSTLTADAAPGVQAFLGQLPSLTAGAASGMSQVTSEFGRSSGAISGATPAINRMVGGLGDLGAELVHTGAGSIVPFSENVGSMARGLSSMTSELGPAIKPSMQAVTDTVNAAAGGIGSLAPDISGFAGTLSANAPQLENIVGSLGRGMLSFGSAAVDGLGMAAPAISQMADSIQSNQGGIANAVGGLVGGAADVIGFASDVIGVGSKIDSAVKSVIKPGGFSSDLKALQSGDTFRPEGLGGASLISGAPKGGFSPEGGTIGDSKLAQWANKTFGMTPAAPVSARGDGAFSPSGFFSKGGMFGQISKSGGLVGMALRGLNGEPLIPAPAQAGARPGVMNAAPLTAAVSAAGAGQLAPSGIPGGAFGGVLAPPMAGLFTGAAQTAQQGAAGIPAAMQSAMQQSHQAVAGANLGGAMRVPLAAMNSAVAGANVGGAVGGQMSRMTQTVESASGGAQASGGKVGAAIGGGVGQGITSTETVTDKIVRNHITVIEDQMNTHAGIHSPARRFRPVGRNIGAGVDVGLERYQPGPAMRSLVGSYESEGIAARGQAAMSASTGRFAQQRAQADADRTMMQGLTISGGGRAPAQRDTAGASTVDLKGRAKQEAFGELQPGMNPKASRMVFDKQVMSWEATGDPIKIGSDGLWSGIRSPLSAKQQTAMESMQAALDPGVNRNFGMFGERTQQNILRNRPGAFQVASAIEDKEAQQRQQRQRFGGKPDIPEFSVGGSGAGGQSYLGRDRIGMVRQAAGLGSDTAAGFGQGIQANLGSAVAPMGRLAAAQKKRYTDDWGIASPSRVAAGYSGDVAAGFGGGLTDNADVPVGAMGTVFDQMASVGNDRSLMVGYTWAQNALTGAAQVLKKADYTSAGLPNLESKAAMTALAATGLLKAGSGASIVKTVGNTPSVVTLGNAAPPAKQSFTIRHQIDMGGQIHEIATEVFLDNLGRVQDAVSAAAR